MDTVNVSRDYVVYGNESTDTIPDSFFSGVRDAEEGRTLPMGLMDESNGVVSWFWRTISIYAFKIGSMFDRLGVLALMMGLG
jgi:hypothetical protein